MAKGKVFSGCGGLLIVVLLAFLAILIRPPVDRRPDLPPAPQSPKPPLLAVGDVATLDDGDGSCTLAVNEHSWNEMLDVQNNKSSMVPLIEAGDVIAAVRGTKVQVAEMAALSCRVRLLDGPLQGQSGWIQKGFLKR